MWDNFFEAGGWGMYPTAIFGFLLVATGVLLVIRPERRFARLVISLGVATAGSGVLSTAVGVVKSFYYLEQAPEARRLLLGALGCAESLHNLVLAMMLVVITALLAGIAALRLVLSAKLRARLGEAG
jgi:hypothetical protein